MTEASSNSVNTHPLVSWFQAHHGYIDNAIVGFTVFSGSGRGAVALQDIPVSSKFNYTK